VTHTFLPPTLIYMVLAHEALDTTDLSSLQCFWYGAAPMSAARLEEALERIGPVMAQLFGQTEAPMMISTLAPRDHFHPDGSVARERLSSAGRPAPLVTVSIMDDQGVLLPRGERGEIVVRSSLVMAGYYKNPEATAEASAHGWHHTGDIGYLDDDGYLFLTDRKAFMIISGGVNIYPQEIEDLFSLHPAVTDIAVIGVPDDEMGERVVAFVEAAPSATPDDALAAELTAYARDHIAHFKVPREFHFRDELPRTPTGKMVKGRLREEFGESAGFPGRVSQ